MLNSITLLGSSSGRNAGDAALISGIMDSLDQASKSRICFEIPTIRPSYIRENYKNQTRPIGMMPWHASIKLLGLPTWRSIMRTDLTLIFDAILFDRSLYNPLFNYMSSLWLMLPLAKKLGKRLGCFNVGLGPVDSDAGRCMLRDILELMDFITVREEHSLKLLRDIGVMNQNVSVCADAAFLVSGSNTERTDQILKSVGLDPSKEILAFNVNHYLDSWANKGKPSIGAERFIEIYAEAVTQVIEKLNTQVAFVCTQVADVELTKRIMAKVNAPRMALITNRDHNHYDIKGVLGRMAMLFGMRLHSQILASSELTPIIGLSFQSKVDHYYKLLGLDKYCLSFDNFNSSALREHVLIGWQNRSEIRKLLQNRVPELQIEARKAANLVVERCA